MAQSKGSHQAANPYEEDANKNKKNSPVCPLHGPGHGTNSCKVILEQTKVMKLTWLTIRGGGVGRIRLQGAKKHPTEGEELNALMSNGVKKFLKTIDV